MSDTFDARATSCDSLEVRLKANSAYGSMDFASWLMKRLQPKKGEHCLDVACGSGMQTIPLASLTGPTGSVSSVDISPESVETLLGRVPTDGAPVQAIAGDMDQLQEIIETKFDVKRYDLAQCSYALYYAKQPLRVLEAMAGALRPGGRCAVFAPTLPHGLVSLASQFTEVDVKVLESLTFATEVVEPWFRSHFQDVELHRFHNVIRVPSADEVISFFRATTYYDAAVEGRMRETVQAEIDRNGAFVYEKNGLLIIGR